MSGNRLLLLAAVAVTTTVTTAGVLAAPVRSARPARVEPVGITAAAAPATPPQVEVLRSWDQRRAAAWAKGDPQLLRALYTPGSLAGRHDRAMLRSWRARGLVVRDLQTQLLSVRELSHSTHSWTLLVTDRLAGGVAVGPGVARRLPRDEPTTRTLRLRLMDGRWRVAAVRPLPS